MERNKLWRKRKSFHLFKKRMMIFAAYSDYIIFLDGKRITNPHWFDIARCNWAKTYKNTPTPCSCPFCKGERYSRLNYKKETYRLLNNEDI